MNTIIPITLDVRRPQAPVSSARYTAKDWDEVRAAFGASILVDTPLTSLTQNLEGACWPLQGRDEVAASYVDLSFDEMRERLALNGQPPKVADQLIDILKETLAFDNPFGEMITLVEATAPAENPLAKNLAKLKIPSHFPVTLTALSPETLLFCRLESITTLGEFALAAQRMAGSVVVGGDFRALLNALSHIDERTLARYLPFRVGMTGLHYIEGLAQGVYAKPVEIQAALARHLKQPLAPAVMDLANSVSSEALNRAKLELQLHAGALRSFCEEEYADLKRQIDAGANVRRLVSVLGDPATEAVVADLLSPEKPPAGWLSRFFSRFRK